MLSKLEDELRFVLITSEAQIKPLAEAPQDASTSDVEGLAVSVSSASGTKCVRCWHHKEDVGTSEIHPELCSRCIVNVDGEGEMRHYA